MFHQYFFRSLAPGIQVRCRQRSKTQGILLKKLDQRKRFVCYTMKRSSLPMESLGSIPQTALSPGVNFTYSFLRLDRRILGHRLLPDLRRNSFCPRLLDHPRHQPEVIDVVGRGERIINNQLFVLRFVAKRMGGVWRYDDVVANGSDHFLRARIKCSGAFGDQEGLVVHLRKRQSRLHVDQGVHT